MLFFFEITKRAQLVTSASTVHDDAHDMVHAKRWLAVHCNTSFPDQSGTPIACHNFECTFAQRFLSVLPSAKVTSVRQ